MQYFGFEFNDSVKKFLDSHTKSNEGKKVFNTFRESKTVPFRWIQELSFPKISQIQTACKEAMDAWGYIPITSEEQHRREDVSQMVTKAMSNADVMFPFAVKT